MMWFIYKDPTNQNSTKKAEREYIPLNWVEDYNDVVAKKHMTHDTYLNNLDHT